MIPSAYLPNENTKGIFDKTAFAGRKIAPSLSILPADKCTTSKTLSMLQQGEIWGAGLARY
ncbi:MAG: hypothetical protein U5L09_21350 [Bacteroidales bacterium]|nr:hypothetical protein [Bacteroidales bacterium]